MYLMVCLPPGLYEMVISPRPAAAQPGTGPDAGMSRFEARTLDDIRALGRNSEADDRAFAAVARMSELTHSAYRTFWQPAIRAMVTEPAADLARALNPLRLSYTVFSDSNPLMKSVEKLAGEVSAARRPAAPDNPFLQLQKQVSDQIVTAMDAYRDTRDRMVEDIFFAVFGSPMVQGMLGVNCGEKVRELPGTTPEKRAAEQAQAAAYAAKLPRGGFDEALVRAVLYVVAAERALDERCAHALYAARRDLLSLPIDQYKTLVRDQFFVLLLERERAVEALATMVREPDQRAELLKRTSAIIGAGDPPTAAERERIARLEKLLAAPAATRAELAPSSHGAVGAAGAAQGLRQASPGAARAARRAWNGLRRQCRRLRDAGGAAAGDRGAALRAGAPAARSAGALPRAQADADRRRAPVQRRCAHGRGGSSSCGADRAGAVRAGSRAAPNRDGRKARPFALSHRPHRRSRGFGAEATHGCRRRRGARADEGQPAHRRAAARSRAEGGQAAERAAAEPLRRRFGADLRPSRGDHRRGAEHCAGHRPEARHLPECHRLRPRTRNRHAERRHSGGRGDGTHAHAGHAGRRDPVENG